MNKPGHIATFTSELMAESPLLDSLLGAFLPMLLVLGFALFLLLADRAAKRLPL